MHASTLFDAESTPRVREHVPYVIALGFVCTSGGPLTIERVEATGVAGRLEVVDWGTRLRYSGDSYGEYTVPLTGRVDQTPGFGRHPVSLQCHKWTGTANEELSIAVSTGSNPASMTGVRIYYRSARGHRTLLVKYGARYCGGSANCPTALEGREGIPELCAATSRLTGHNLTGRFGADAADFAVGGRQAQICRPAAC